MWWRSGLIILCVIAVCFGQNNYELNVHKKKPGHHHHDAYSHLLYAGGILSYLSFVLIKIKVVYVLATIFTIFVVAGKVYAIIKLVESSKESKHHDDHHHEPEKIYIQGPSHGPSFYSQPGPPQSAPYSFQSQPSHDYTPYSSHSSGITVDKLPPNAVVAGGQYDSFPQQGYNSYASQSNGITVDKLPPNAEVANGHYYDSPPPNGYGRSSSQSNDLSTYYHLFIKLMNKMNLTEMAFQKMRLKTSDCKRKFVCRIEFDAKSSPLLSAVVNFFRDEHYHKFKTATTINSLDDCNELYPCSVNM